MPTALEVGRYTSNGFQLSRHRQEVRATGLPLPSTWASAASSSGVMTAVECLAKSRPYWRQVRDGCLASEPLTGKNTSAGLRATCTIQFNAAQTATTRTVPRTIRMANGATPKAKSARPARRHATERRARRLRVRVLWSAPREIVTWGMMGVTPVCPGRQFPATPTRQHWDGGTLFRYWRTSSVFEPPGSPYHSARAGTRRDELGRGGRVATRCLRRDHVGGRGGRCGRAGCAHPRLFHRRRFPSAAGTAHARPRSSVHHLPSPRVREQQPSRTCPKPCRTGCRLPGVITPLEDRARACRRPFVRWCRCPSASARH